MLWEIFITILTIFNFIMLLITIGIRGDMRNIQKSILESNRLNIKNNQELINCLKTFNVEQEVKRKRLEHNV